VAYLLTDAAVCSMVILCSLQNSPSSRFHKTKIPTDGHFLFRSQADRIYQPQRNLSSLCSPFIAAGSFTRLVNFYNNNSVAVAIRHADHMAPSIRSIWH
jgi:hypothetical protein